MCGGKLSATVLSYLPGTPGKRFAEKTVNGSVNVCARMGETPVCTRIEPGSGAGGLWSD